MNERLFTPGPTPVPEAIRRAMARPMMHHRSQAFREILGRVSEGLRWVFHTEHEVLMLGGSGTAAMEAAVVNFCAPGDVVLYVDAGQFGARWGALLAAYGIEAVAIEVPWGQAVTEAQLAEAFRSHPHAAALLMQACETSTGVMHPVQEAAALCRALPSCLCVVDGITAVGIEPLPMDAWGIDVLLGATQKSFMMSAGLALVAVSERAWARAERPGLPRFYLDLRRERAARRSGHTAWSTAVSLVFGLEAALARMQAEGRDALYARHQALSARCRAEAARLGCRPYAQRPARGLTVVRPPDGLDAIQVITSLREHEGMRIGGGLERAAGAILRLAHMGAAQSEDLDELMAALARTFERCRTAP